MSDLGLSFCEKIVFPERRSPKFGELLEHEFAEAFWKNLADKGRVNEFKMGLSLSFSILWTASWKVPRSPKK